MADIADEINPIPDGEGGGGSSRHKLDGMDLAVRGLAGIGTGLDFASHVLDLFNRSDLAESARSGALYCYAAAGVLSAAR